MDQDVMGSEKEEERVQEREAKRDVEELLACRTMTRGESNRERERESEEGWVGEESSVRGWKMEGGGAWEKSRRLEEGWILLGLGAGGEAKQGGQSV